MKSMNEILIKTKKGKHLRKAVRESAQKILEILSVTNSELSILLTDDEEIKSLNSAFRKKDRATDVLSFPIDEIVGGRKILGDVVISVDTAKKQARERGITLREEVTRLLVHGILHLLGYDHEKGGEEEKLFRRLEEMVCDRLGSGKGTDHRRKESGS